MRVDLQSPEIWEDLNESLRTKFFSAGTGTVLTYPSPTHALYELCEGASNFFSHKRSFGLIKGTTPVFPSLLAGFYKDGYQVQAVSFPEFKDPKAWVDGLKKDTNFVIFSSDNPLTGECMAGDALEALDTLLNEKKIFSFRISHSDWIRTFKAGGFPSPRPFSATILCAGPGLALTLKGEKVKAPSVTTASLDWNSEAVLSHFQKAVETFHENETAVKKLEKNLSSGWQSFATGENRLFDRALIFHKEINAESLLPELYKKIGAALPKLGGFASVETSSLCRWNGFNTFYNWWDSAPDAETLRGLLVVDAGLASNPQFSTWLAEAQSLSQS